MAGSYHFCSLIIRVTRSPSVILFFYYKILTMTVYVLSYVTIKKYFFLRTIKIDFCVRLEQPYSRKGLKIRFFFSSVGMSAVSFNCQYLLEVQNIFFFYKILTKVHVDRYQVCCLVMHTRSPEQALFFQQNCYLDRLYLRMSTDFS